MCARLWFGLVAAALLGTSAAAQVTILTNATVIDGTGSPPQANVTIVIEGGRIVDMRPTPQDRSIAAVRPDMTFVDLTGKYVVPGIINAHGHVGPPARDPQLRQYARRFPPISSRRSESAT